MLRLLLLILCIALFFNQFVSGQQPESDSLIRLVTNSHKDTLLADRFMEAAMKLVYNNQQEAQRYCEEALAIYKKYQHHEGESHALNLLGLQFLWQAKLDKALEYAQESYAVAQKHQLPHRMAKALNNIGNIYLHIKEYDRALATYNEAYALNKQLGNREEMGNNLANNGVVMVNLQRYDSALVFYHQALSLFIELGFNRGIATMYNNIANIHNRRKQYDEALFYFKKSLYHYSLDNNILYASNVYNNIGSMFLLEGKLDSAGSYLNEGLRLAEAQGSIDELCDAHNHLSTFYEQKGDYKQALIHLRKHIFFKDSLFNQEKTNELKNIAQQYTVQKQLEVMQKDSELAEAKFLSWIVALAALLIIVSLTGAIYNISLTRNSVRKALYEEEKARFHAEKEAQELREIQYTAEIDLKNRELASTAVNIIQKNDLLQQITDNLDQLKKTTTDEAARRELSRLTRLIENGLNQEQE